MPDLMSHHGHGPQLRQVFSAIVQDLGTPMENTWNERATSLNLLDLACKWPNLPYPFVAQIRYKPDGSLPRDFARANMTSWQARPFEATHES